MATNPIFHARTKHVEVYYHFVREKVLQKTMEVHYVNTQVQLADIFIKGLHPRRFQLLCSKLHVTDSPMSLKGAVNRVTQELRSVEDNSDSVILKRADGLHQLTNRNLVS